MALPPQRGQRRPAAVAGEPAAAAIRAGRTHQVGYLVGAYITAAYWFTSSTSFANPAVTIARMFSDTFAGTAHRCRSSRRPDAQAAPELLFVCVHNGGRSQMAAGYLSHLSHGKIEVRSACSEPAQNINAIAVQAMAEECIDITAEKPKILTTDAVKASDVVITTGCGDTCPYYPGKGYEDWVLDDPAGQNLNHVRPIRDEIRRRVEQLISELY